MNGSREQILQNYYEQFKDSEWAYFLIPKLNPKSLNEENISKILDSNIKKAPLKSVISFLKKTFSKKYPKAVKGIAIKPHATKNDIAYQIVKFVGLSHPYNNKDEQNDYTESEDSESEYETEEQDSYSEWEPESDYNEDNDEDIRAYKLKEN